MARVSRQVFRFHDQHTNPPHDFRCHLDSEQCQDRIHNGRGRRCKNQTVIGVGYCRAHLRSKWGLDITPADNPNHGLGIRAVGDPNQVIFELAGENIAYYKGEHVIEEELNEK